MTDNKNTILAIVLSALVLIAWQYFYGAPAEKAHQQALQQQAAKQTSATPTTTTQTPQTASPAASGPAPQVPGAAPQSSAPASLPRAQALAASPRVPIETASLRGSIALKGGRIDDLALNHYHEPVDPKSPPIFLLSPSGTADPFYAEFGWTPAGNAKVPVPGTDTVWKQQGSGPLTTAH